MQIRRLLSTAFYGITLLSITAPAMAVMSVPYGWYVEANAGSTNLSNKSYPGSSSSSGLGGSGDIGYKFMPYFALEAGYSQYANTTIEDNAGTKAGTDKHYSYNIAGRGILPIVDSGVELFAKLGVGRVNSNIDINNETAANNIGLGSGSHTAAGIYYGAGIQYYVMPELAVNVQWNQAQGSSSTGNLALFSGGLSFILD